MSERERSDGVVMHHVIAPDPATGRSVHWWQAVAAVEHRLSQGVLL